MTSFTLLLPVYGANSPEQLRQAFRSSVDEQTRRPDAVVITIDGPVPPTLDAVIADLVDTSPVAARVIRLPQNRGLATALNAGIDAIDTEYIARMDADDVCRPERFERQLSVIEARDLDILGTGLAEFAGSSDAVIATRTPPLGGQIRRRAPFAQPFNHPTVIYRRAAVLAVGGYPTDVGRLEDYVLFARMLVAGARADNLAEPLLLYRVDNGAYTRRGGWGQFRSELRLQRELLRVGLTSPAQYARNVVLRGSYRLAPTWLRRGGYRAAATGWRRSHGG